MYDIATHAAGLASVPVLHTVFSRVLLRFTNMRAINYAWPSWAISSRGDRRGRRWSRAPPVYYTDKILSNAQHDIKAAIEVEKRSM